jgi:hypothetical protein
VNLCGTLLCKSQVKAYTLFRSQNERMFFCVPRDKVKAYTLFRSQNERMFFCVPRDKLLKQISFAEQQMIMTYSADDHDIISWQILM